MLLPGSLCKSKFCLTPPALGIEARPCGAAGHVELKSAVGAAGRARFTGRSVVWSQVWFVLMVPGGDVARFD